MTPRRPLPSPRRERPPSVLITQICYWNRPCPSMLLEDQTYSFGNPALLLGHTAFANKDCKNLSSLWGRLFQLWKISFVIFTEIGLLFAEGCLLAEVRLLIAEDGFVFRWYWEDSLWSNFLLRWSWYERRRKAFKMLKYFPLKILSVSSGLILFFAVLWGWHQIQ